MDGSGKSGRPVRLPCNEPHWHMLTSALQQLQRIEASGINELRKVLGGIQKICSRGLQRSHQFAGGSSNVFDGLIHFLESEASEAERKVFFEKSLWIIATYALKLKEWQPKDTLSYILQQQEGTTVISRRFAASLNAHSFLCTLGTDDQLELSQPNFKFFFKHLENMSMNKSQAAKLRCILHYFTRLADEFGVEGPPGNLTLTRKTLEQDQMPSFRTWMTSTVPLCGIMVRPQGSIEDAGSQVAQVDFANRFIGGGVLGSGLVQEEIRFTVCPELIAFIVFTECMEENEAIEVSGFQQFSSYSGYRKSFAFEGNLEDMSEINPQGDIESTLIAIDAQSFYDNTEDQFQEKHLQRDLNKALIGFLPFHHADDTASSFIETDDNDISMYTDATDFSGYTLTETEFETASESLDAPPAKQLNLKSVKDYGHSLSKAITDIAVKDAAIVESSSKSSNASATSEQDASFSNIYDKNQRLSFDVDSDYGYDLDSGSVPKGSHRLTPNISYFSDKLAHEILNNSLKDVFRSLDSKPHLNGEVNGENFASGTNHKPNTMSSVSPKQVSSLSKIISLRVMDELFDDSPEAFDLSHNGVMDQNEYARKDSCLLSLVDDLVSSAVTEALHQKKNQLSPSENGSIQSGLGSSLGDFSVISSVSVHSDTFVKINRDLEEDDHCLSVPGEQPSSSVDKFVEVIVKDTVNKVKSLNESPTDEHSHLIGRSSVNHENRTAGAATASLPVPNGVDDYSWANRVTKSQKIPQLGKCVVLDSADNNRKQLRNYGGETLVLDFQTVEDSCSKEEKDVSDFAAKLCQNIFSGALSSLNSPQIEASNQVSARRPVMDIPGTPPPSPTFPEFDGSSRSSFSEAELVIFGEQYLNNQLAEARNHRHVPEGLEHFGEVRTYVEEVLDNDLEIDEEEGKDDNDLTDEEGALELQTYSNSRRSSARSSGPKLDSFTEGLLKIGNIDPEGRRPSRTEESLQHFSQELAKMMEKDKLEKRRESDIDSIAFEFFHVPSPPQPVAVHIDSRIASIYASRLAADIIQDVAIQMYGSVFPNSVRLIPAEVGDFPRRREPSESDLLSLAANLANVILESALRTFRRDYLGQYSDDLQSDSDDRSEVTGSDMYSKVVNYDASSIDFIEDDSQEEDEQSTRFSSVDDLAGFYSNSAIFGAMHEIRKIHYLRELFNDSCTAEQRTIATGNWGCGVFGGDPQLKSLLQWMAASQAGIPTLYYYTFKDERMETLEQVVDVLRMQEFTVGRLAHLILMYSQSKQDTHQELFQYILSQR